MSNFKHISCEATAESISQETCVVVDIRDEDSFNKAHIEGSFNLSNGNLSQFMQQTDPDSHVVVVCYHGVSSQGAAEYLTQQGFDEVSSMDGGFEHWRKTQAFVSNTEA